MRTRSRLKCTSVCQCSSDEVARQLCAPPRRSRPSADTSISPSPSSFPRSNLAFVGDFPPLVHRIELLVSPPSHPTDRAQSVCVYLAPPSLSSTDQGENIDHGWTDVSVAVFTSTNRREKMREREREKRDSIRVLTSEIKARGMDARRDGPIGLEKERMEHPFWCVGLCWSVEDT